MNIYDKASLFSMSYAFMRRFAFIDVPAPSSKAYGQLMDYFIDRYKLCAVKPEAGQSDACMDFKELFNEKEKTLMSYRSLGPAIAIDMLRYLKSRTGRQGKYHHGHLAEALSLYVLPQLDGLEQESILNIYEQLCLVFQAFRDELLVGPIPEEERRLRMLIAHDFQAVKQRIRELFPFVQDRDWLTREPKPPVKPGE